MSQANSFPEKSYPVDADYSADTNLYRAYKLSSGTATVATAQGELAPLVL